MSIKERIIKFIDAKGIKSIRKFEDICGLSNGYVNKITHSIGPDKMRCITLHFPDLNPAWLQMGIGEMLKNEEEKKEREPDFALLANMSLEKALAILVETNSKLVEENSKLSQENKDLRNEAEVLKKALGVQSQVG